MPNALTCIKSISLHIIISLSYQYLMENPLGRGWGLHFHTKDSCVNYGYIVGRSPLDDDYADNDCILMARSRASELDLVLRFPGKKYFNEFYQEYHTEKFILIYLK